MGAVILILSTFVIGAGLVFGGYFAVTKLPGYLVQRRLNSRLEGLTRPADAPEGGDPAGLVKDRSGGSAAGVRPSRRRNRDAARRSENGSSSQA